MVKRPDPLESTPPAFGEEAARQILREGFGVESSSIKPLAGERDQNFRVDTAGGQRFLFKISNPVDDRPVLAMQAAALRHVERVDPGLPVMRALPTAAGESWVEVPGPDSRTYPARLFTFLPGQVTANRALTSDAIWAHGQITARLGRALRGFFHPAADYEILWGITRLRKLRPLLTYVSDGQRRAQVEWVLDRFETRVAPALPGLRAQGIHGDMSLDNVLFDDDRRVSGTVDFRDMTHPPLACSRPVHLVRGEGVWLFDPDDQRYLDCYNNVPVVGHSHPRVVQAVAQQQRLLATHSRYLHEAIVELAERLQATLPPELNAVMVVNSGSEANDLAWRIARAATRRDGAVVTACAYHGLTQATHALSPEEWAKGEQPAHVATIPAPDGYRGPYRREEDRWVQRYAAHIDDAARGLGDRGFAAIYLDPAFTADGILWPPSTYLREAARRALALGGLVVADEVQAGHGRSGTHLGSFQASGIAPDMVVMGKPMGNGFPVAALVVRSQLLAAVPEEVELFSTFGGNPVACAAALAVLAVIEDEGLVANAAKVGSYLRQGLLTLAERHPLIGDVRGEGLLLGVELVDEARGPAAGNARKVTEAIRERGGLVSATGPAGNVLKIRPPLVFQHEHADLLLQALDRVLASS